MKMSPDVKPKIIDKIDLYCKSKPKVVDDSELENAKKAELMSKRINWIYNKLINSGKIPDFEEGEFKSYLDYKRDKTKYFVDVFYRFFMDFVMDVTHKMMTLFIYFSLMAILIFQLKSFVGESGILDFKSAVLSPEVLMNYLLSGDFITPEFMRFYVFFGIILVTPSLSTKISNLLEALFFIPRLSKKKKFNDVNSLYNILESGADLDDLPDCVLNDKKFR